ncbi:hypothetical protein LU293_01565 [Moraxella nasovis]|uniref:hypothetical protein n=1 Tax=Moraxella nasovis TaxID=2904121 RepID=UPI001F615990|nr:hypothetical protein [Moraxella nasovis]UNU73626.1 hypothetical protein LU293_01565 [Moraxella nasovis]
MLKLFSVMNPKKFHNHLHTLKHDRFGLSTLLADEFYQFRLQILAEFQADHTLNDWYLIGTDGCHLCQIASELLAQTATIQNLPPIQTLDLVDCQSVPIIDSLGVHIPILITPTRLLCYPFGMMDILSLSQQAY